MSRENEKMGKENGREGVSGKEVKERWV